MLVGPNSGARLYYALSQMIVVRGGLGARVGRCLGAVCLAIGMSGVVGFGIVAACSLINFCLCALMPKSLVCAKEQSLLRRVFAILLSWKRAVELVSGVLCPFRLRSWAMEGRTFARADAKSFTVSMRVVPAWPMGMHTNSTRPQYFRRAVSKGRYLSVFSVYF
jgi:hypothetical protein